MSYVAAAALGLLGLVTVLPVWWGGLGVYMVGQRVADGLRSARSRPFPSDGDRYGGCFLAGVGIGMTGLLTTAAVPYGAAWWLWGDRAHAVTAAASGVLFTSGALLLLVGSGRPPRRRNNGESSS